MSESEKAITEIENENETVTAEATSEQTENKDAEAEVKTATQQCDNKDFLNRNMQPDVQREAKPQLGLKWAKFLGYFMLWFSALSNAATAINYISGAVYTNSGVSAEYVYRFFPALKPVDYLYGFAILVLVVFYVITALAIIKRKKTAIRFVPTVYFATSLSCLIYVVLSSIITGSFLLTANIGISIVGQLGLGFVNKYYFERRKDIFTK